MKRETIITSIITVLLNTTWSIIFDLLPNIVDFSIFGEIKISKYLLFIPLLIFLNIIVILIFRKILRKSWERETFIDQLTSAIKKLIEEEAISITERPPVVRPGPPQVFLKYFYDVINQINKLNGKIEFEIENSPTASFDLSMPVYISNITPGMCKYLMIITQNKERQEADFIRIIPDYESTTQEFTYTWFDRILSLVGNMSDKISAKEEPLQNQHESSGCYEIREYRFVTKKQKHYFRFDVI